MEAIIKIFEKVQPYFGAMNPQQYDFYRDADMPRASAIVRVLEKSWNEIMDSLGLPRPLDRETLANLSRALHLLEKRIVVALGLGWNESNFQVSKRKMRPDACCLERMYLRNDQLLVLDIKLSICSSLFTVYKYLPIFENPKIPNQLTFFPSWLPESANNGEPEQIYHDGQLGMFLETNILYICYLLGMKRETMLPGSEISHGKVSPEKKKKLPTNMEVRFIEFAQLPELYCKIAGIECDREAIAPILATAAKIKGIATAISPDAEKISREIYLAVRNGKMIE